MMSGHTECWEPGFIYEMIDEHSAPQNSKLGHVRTATHFGWQPLSSCLRGYLKENIPCILRD